jgi:kynurenine formamidase
MTGDGANYLVERKIKGIGVDTLSTGGYGDEHVEGDAHKELLSNGKLLLEDIHIPEELLDRQQRHFAAFPILIANAGGSWARAIVWDTGDLDRNVPSDEKRTQIPPSIAGQIELERASS